MRGKSGDLCVSSVPKQSSTERDYRIENLVRDGLSWLNRHATDLLLPNGLGPSRELNIPRASAHGGSTPPRHH